MSYNIQLYRKEVKKKHITSNDENFFESEENLVPFTKEQKEYLKKRLLRSGYIIENEENEIIAFGFKKDNATTALLTNSGLFFSSSGDGIVEISMTSSEFTDTEEFLKYDPQDNGWEEI